MSRPLPKTCRNGHVYAVVGRNQNRRCAECAREWHRNYRRENAERLRPVWRERRRLDRECYREAGL